MTCGPNCCGPGSTSSTATSTTARPQAPHRTAARIGAGLAVRRAPQRRDRPAPRRLHPHAKITPATLTRAYQDAGYFERNLRTIEVLIDRDAVTSGQAAAGQPWQYYDLGHGPCSYTFFEQCPHRMACAKCDFYTPKDSSRALLLEAKDNLQRMLAAVPLTDDERAAVDDGQAALDKLLSQLADTPTPAGPTPRQLGHHVAGPPLLQILPGPPTDFPLPETRSS